MISSSPPEEHRVAANGIELAWFEWNADERGVLPTILLAHATGFHARCWDQLVPHLGNRHVISVDLRGHGRSTHVEFEHWEAAGRDLADLILALELESVLGVGHSMGGHSMVDAAALVPGPFVGLVLLDPVIGEPGGYVDGGWIPEVFREAPHPTVKRRNHFDSVQAMIDRFADRPPYAGFDRAVLRDYCEYGLLPDTENGGYKLACPPAVEASVYMTSRTNKGIFESVAKVSVPVFIVRAKRPTEDRELMDFSVSPTWPGLVDAFPDGRELHFSDRTHFLPQEDPAGMAALILEHDAWIRGDSA